jgi:hypothetical protein
MTFLDAMLIGVAVIWLIYLLLRYFYSDGSGYRVPDDYYDPETGECADAAELRRRSYEDKHEHTSPPKLGVLL